MKKESIWIPIGNSTIKKVSEIHPYLIKKYGVDIGNSIQKTLNVTFLKAFWMQIGAYKRLMHSGRRGWQNYFVHSDKLKSIWAFWKLLDIFWGKLSVKAILKHEWPA